MGIGRVANNSSPRNTGLLNMLHRGLGLELALVNTVMNLPYLFLKYCAPWSYLVGRALLNRSIKTTTISIPYTVSFPTHNS
jgi:hypothetical protein